MAGQITLYKDAQLTQPLTNGTWATTVDLGSATIPAQGEVLQAGVLCYGKNTGTTTIRQINITPVASSGTGGQELAADVEIAPDVHGTEGSYGGAGTQALVYPGNLQVATHYPSTNTSGTVADPNVLANLSVGANSTNLPAGLYTVGYAFFNSTGETRLSPTSPITLAAGQSVRVGAVPLPPNATGVRFYLSDRAGDATGLYLAGTNAGYTQIELMGAYGFFQFWARQRVTSADTPGVKQAKLQIDALDIG